MQPARYSLVIWEGATFRLVITVLQPDGVTPFDYTGFTATLPIRLSRGSSPLFTLTTSNGGITLGGTAGTVSLFISATNTLSFDSWAATGAVYELDAINTGGNGDTIPLLYGRVQVHRLP